MASTPLFRGCFRAAYLLAAMALFASIAFPARGADMSDGELLGALRQGGLIIYFRHADTGPATPEPPSVQVERCETQRNLNDNGRAQAREIGAQLRRLNIPVGKVLSSRFCRCIDTAQLAFGRHEVAQVLTGVRRGPEFADARRGASEGLRALLSTPPPEGENTVLVSHGFNLIDLEGLYLGTQGEAAVYRADGRGGYALLARVLPEGWASLERTAR